MSEEIFERLTRAILEGKYKDAVSFCREAVEKGLTARSVLERWTHARNQEGRRTVQHR